MTILVILAALAVLIALWVVWFRPWMRDKPWAAGFFAWIEPIEIALWRKSETILWARTKMLIGALLTILTTLGTIDLTPLMPFIPDQYESLVRMIINLSPLALTVVGWVDEQLRKDTTKPLEVVALPEDKSLSVAEAVARVESANAVAVAVIDAEKEQGAM